MINNTRFVSGKDDTAKNEYFAGIGMANITFRGMQTDLNLFAKACCLKLLLLTGSSETKLLSPRTCW